jgi:hypothetical protein
MEANAKEAPQDPDPRNVEQARRELEAIEEERRAFKKLRSR